MTAIYTANADDETETLAYPSVVYSGIRVHGYRNKHIALFGLEVGRYPLADIDISDPKYRQYRYRYPLLQRSLAYIFQYDTIR